jgi:hypothetical protein
MKTKTGYCIVYEWPADAPNQRKAVVAVSGRVWDTLKEARAFKKAFLSHIGTIVKIG